MEGALNEAEGLNGATKTSNNQTYVAVELEEVEYCLKQLEEQSYSLQIYSVVLVEKEVVSARPLEALVLATYLFLEVAPVVLVKCLFLEELEGLVEQGLMRLIYEESMLDKGYSHI